MGGRRKREGVTETEKDREPEGKGRVVREAVLEAKGHCESSQPTPHVSSPILPQRVPAATSGNDIKVPHVRTHGKSLYSDCDS